MVNSKVFTQSDTCAYHTAAQGPNNPSKTACVLATQINCKVDAKWLEGCTGSSACRGRCAAASGWFFSWTCSAPLRQLNHKTLPPKGSLARSVALRSLWAREEQNYSFCCPDTTIDIPPAPLRTEWDSAFSNPYSGAGLAMKRAFCALRAVSLCCFGPNFNCSCEPLSKVAKSWPKSSPR